VLEPQPSEPLLFVLGALAVWRVTALVAYESGPFRIVDRLRGRMVALGLERLVGCFHCLATWVAAGVVLVVYELTWWSLLLWPAVAGAASIVERWLGGTMSIAEVNDDV
jgi:hypothetical protein